jgi:HK97 family phage major capsid protein
LKLSNEMVLDSTTNVTQALGTLLRDSLSAQLDSGLLLGTGAPQPDGLIAKAAAVTGTGLLGAVSAAVGAIGDAGGVADCIAISATQLATENAKLATTGGALLYPAGFPAAVGLKAVVVPGLAAANTLVYDSSRVFLVLGQDSTAEYSNDYFFGDDAVAIRIKTRVNAAAPVPAKAMRKLTVTLAAAEEAPPTKATARK